MYSKFKLEKQSSLLKIQNHLVSIFLSFLILVLSISIPPSTYAQSTPLLIFFNRDVNFDQQFQQTLTDLLQKNVEGFKFG